MKWIGAILINVISGIIVYHVTESKFFSPPESKLSTEDQQYQTILADSEAIVVDPIDTTLSEEEEISNVGDTEVQEDKTIYIKASLTTGMYSEDVYININGTLIAELILTENKPTCEVTVNLPYSENAYTYTTTVTGSYMNQFGTLFSTSVYGEGIISLEDGNIVICSFHPNLGFKLTKGN